MAYSTLADLIHHVRSELKLEQLSKVIYLYLRYRRHILCGMRRMHLFSELITCRNLHDTSLPFTIQTMSAKLLLNLVEFMVQKKGRQQLLRILDAFVRKFSSLQHQIPGVLEGNETSESGTPVIKGSLFAYPFLSSAYCVDCQLLVTSLVLALRNIVWGINTLNQAHATQPHHQPIPQPGPQGQIIQPGGQNPAAINKMMPGQPVHNAQMMPGQPIHSPQMQFGHMPQVTQSQAQPSSPQSLLEGTFFPSFGC